MAAKFDLDGLIEELCAAALSTAPTAAVRNLLAAAVADPGRLARDLPVFDEDDVILFEDETVSIWHCRFPPGTLVPPHDHRVSVIIGVYQGAEENGFYRRADGELKLIKTKEVGPGEVLSIGPRGIHTVCAKGGQPSCAIHVYLGALTKIERNLYDWQSGDPMPFTDENYDKLKKEL